MLFSATSFRPNCVLLEQALRSCELVLHPRAPPQPVAQRQSDSESPWLGQPRFWSAVDRNAASANPMANNVTSTPHAAISPSRLNGHAVETAGDQTMAGSQQGAAGKATEALSGAADCGGNAPSAPGIDRVRATGSVEVEGVATQLRAPQVTVQKASSLAQTLADHRAPAAKAKASVSEPSSSGHPATSSHVELAVGISHSVPNPNATLAAPGSNAATPNIGEHPIVALPVQMPYEDGLHAEGEEGVEHDAMDKMTTAAKATPMKGVFAAVGMSSDSEGSLPEIDSGESSDDNADSDQAAG